MIYHINDLKKLEKRIGIKKSKIKKSKINKSIEKSITITNDDRKLIKIIYEEDYENIDLIRKHMYKSS